jgi:hypothetical protein
VTDAELDELSLRMFRVFARAEYALKAAGFAVGGTNVRADWPRFAASITAAFEAPGEPGFAEAVGYILAHPPRRQVLRDGLLEWDDTAPGAASHADLVLAYVRRVRNNLFHGGKFNGHWFAPQRSGELLTFSLIILQRSISLSAPVSEAYGED